MARRRHSNRRRRRGNFGFLYKLLSVLVICAAVVMALTLFFRVDTIEVTGTERYTEKDVIEASGLCAENADLLEQGLRVFPGLALYDGTWEQPDEVVHYWERKYGLVRL